MDELMYGIAMGNKAHAEGAEKAILIYRDTLEKERARIRELRAELHTMRTRAENAESNAAGRLAQVEAFLASHPQSPLTAHSGKTFKDGRPKTKIRLVFEEAFDATARQWGITAPASRRSD